MSEARARRLAPRLILIEGLPGSGKSTSARRLCAALRERGVDTEEHLEADDDNPIRVGSVVRDLEAAILDYRPSDRLEDWASLAKRVEAGDSRVVLESRFIQNAGMFAYLGGARFPEVLAHTREIERRLRATSALCIVLRVADARDHMQQAVCDGHPDWVSRVTRAFDATPWMTSRSAAGVEGFIEFFVDWARCLDDLVSLLEIDVLVIDEPQLDWEKASREILSRVLPGAA